MYIYIIYIKYVVLGGGFIYISFKDMKDQYHMIRNY